MALSTYITQENVKFDGTATNAVVIGVEGSVTTLVATDTLSVAQQGVLEKFMAETATTPSAARAELMFPGKLLTDPTGLSNVEAAAGTATLAFASPISAGTPSGLNTGTAAAGSQVVLFSQTLRNSLATGLEGTGTFYTAQITVDGTPFTASYEGDEIVSFGELIIKLNETFAGAALAAIVPTGIEIMSTTVGPTSTVAIANTNLFSLMDGYTSIAAATVGGGKSRTYSALVIVDGIQQRVTVGPDHSSTMGTVVQQINNVINGVTAAIVDGKIVITSSTTGAGSSVRVQDNDLFGGLAGNNGFTFVQGVSSRIYTITVTLNGTVTRVDVDGTDAQTFAVLGTLLTAALGSAVASVDGKITITSPTTGLTSSVVVTDTNLLKSITGFSGIHNVKGATSRLQAFYAPLQFNSSDAIANQFIVKKVGLTPAIPPVPGKANLPKTLAYAYFGGTPADWRFLKDDTVV